MEKKSGINKNVVQGANLSAGGNIHIGDVNAYHQRAYNHIPPDNSNKLVPSQPISIAHFVGREDLLTSVKQSYTAGTRVQVLHGMLGIGKRRAVYEYVHRAKSDGLYKEFIWVIDFKNIEESTDTEIANWFDALELGDPKLTDAEKYRRLFNWLSAPDRDGLLILANASSYSDIKDFVSHGGFHVLVTTENPDLGISLHKPILHKVGPLDEASSIKLLDVRSGGRMDKEAISNLAANLAGYPFFLEQFGALYAANILNIEDIDQIISSVAQEEGAALEERRQSFLLVLFSIAGVNEQKPRLKGGVAELNYLFKVMAYAPIPRDFVVEYGAHLLEGWDEIDGITGRLLKPFMRWVLKLRKRIAQQKVSYLSKLAKHSLIHIDEEGLINMHSLVQDFFKDHFVYKGNKFLERVIRGEQLLEYTRKHLRMSSKNPEYTAYGRTILPHAIYIADYYCNRFQKIGGLDLLYRRIGDFYEFEQRPSAALTYFVKALHVQERQKDGVVSKSLVEEAFLNAVYAGRINTYDELKQKFPQEQYLKEYQILFCEALKHYAQFNHQEAKSLLKLSLEKVPEDFDPGAIQELQLLLKVINPDPPSPENEAALKEEENIILAEEGEQSTRYATFLLLKSEVRSRQAEQAEDPMALLEDALELIKKGLSILEEINKQNTFVYWAGKLGQLDYERRLGNKEEVRTLLADLDAREHDLENHLGAQNHLFVAIALAKAQIAEIENDSIAYSSALKMGIQLLEHNFPNNCPDHPLRRLFEELLDKGIESAD